MSKIKRPTSALASDRPDRATVVTLGLFAALAVGGPIDATRGLAAPSEAPAASVDPKACGQIASAMTKTAGTPYASLSMITLAAPHDTKTNAGPASSRTSETIFTGDTLFVRSGGGQWRKIDADIHTLQELVRKATSALGNCRDLGSDQLGETPVAVFSADEGSKSHGTTTKQWIDKASGVLVKSETDTMTAEGSRHSVIQYKYGNVAAPKL